MAQYRTKDLPEAHDPSAYVRLHAFSGGRMATPACFVIKGLRGACTYNSWRNLILHEPSGTKLWFDLGLSDDLSQYPPQTQRYEQTAFQAQAAETNIQDDALSAGVDPKDVKYIIASHSHWDHTYPVGSYFQNAKLLCGPGTLKLTAKSWPDYPDSGFDGRIWNPEKSELPIEEFPDPREEPEKWRRVGPFQHGYDFFGDGSFWIIHAPGHCVGNLIALARTRSKHGERRWVLLGGDCMHSYHFLQFPNAPFGDGIEVMPTGMLHADVEEARKVIESVSSLKTVYGSELFVWPAHVENLEGIWELES